MRTGGCSQAETDVLAQNTAVLRYATHFILKKRAQKNASFSGISIYVLAHIHLWDDQGFATVEMGYLGRHIHVGDEHDYHDILERDLATVEAHAERHARQAVPANAKIGFEDMLHPVIYEHGFQHYLNGHYREAVLNSIVAVFDLI